MSAICRASAVLVLLLIVWSSNAAETEGALSTSADAPRYELVPGQELTYRLNWSTSYQKGDRRSVIDERTDVTVWVLRANGDGSRRLGFRETEARTKTAGGKKEEGEPGTTLFYADVFPDGREQPRWAVAPTVNLAAVLFPPLPRDLAQAKAGWSGTPQEFRFVCGPAESPGERFVFDAKIETPFDKTMGDSHDSKYTFNMSRGLIVRSDDAWARDSKIQGKGGGTTELLGAKAIDPAAMEQLAGDAARYFPAVEIYDARMRKAAEATPDEARQQVDSALAELKSIATALRQPDFKADAGEWIAEHDRWARDVVQHATDLAGRIGKPAPAFETTDLDGNKVRLPDLRGKVVVLDFWYRGCGWCIRSMPQMNQLAGDFAGQPVAILGMNIDTDPADARIVADAMRLKYPTLQAEKIADPFGVTGYPTVILIDRHGTVRAMHDGFNPTLRQDLGKAVRALLAEK
jgi:thiol-disulfide isomerase/thioredoxin